MKKYAKAFLIFIAVIVGVLCLVASMSVVWQYMRLVFL